MVIASVATTCSTKEAKIPRILVVEDDELLLRTVSRMLRDGGHTVFGATDVETALRIVRRETLDTALVDYGLRRESGMEVLGALRVVMSSCTRVLMTGRTEGDIFVDAIRLGGVHEVLRKPFSRDQLFEALSPSRDVITPANATHEEERQALDDAVSVEMLGMALQPIHDAWAADENDNVMAYEALLRPTHPDFPNPLQLLDAAERHARVNDIGSIVMGLAASRIPRLPEGTLLFVNVHPWQLGEPEVLLRDLEHLQPAAKRVVLEITERRPIEEIEDLHRTVRRIRDRGFSFAVDDLGVGYSSLAIVADLGPEYIKLDMSLIRNIEQNPRRTRLVQSLQRFGEQTEIRVIAEGVETAEERDALLECGIKYMQGYFWSRPSEATP